MARCWLWLLAVVEAAWAVQLEPHTLRDSYATRALRKGAERREAERDDGSNYEWQGDDAGLNLSPFWMIIIVICVVLLLLVCIYSVCSHNNFFGLRDSSRVGVEDDGTPGLSGRSMRKLRLCTWHALGIQAAFSQRSAIACAQMKSVSARCAASSQMCGCLFVKTRRSCVSWIQMTKTVSSASHPIRIKNRRRGTLSCGSSPTRAWWYRWWIPLVHPRPDAALPSSCSPASHWDPRTSSTCMKLCTLKSVRAPHSRPQLVSSRSRPTLSLLRTGYVHTTIGTVPGAGRLGHQQVPSRQARRKCRCRAWIFDRLGQDSVLRCACEAVLEGGACVERQMHALVCADRGVQSLRSGDTLGCGYERVSAFEAMKSGTLRARQLWCCPGHVG